MSRMEREQTTSRAHRIRNEVLQIALLSVVILAARSSLADHYVIPSASMEYTLLVGDHVVVDKLAYGTRIPFTRFELAAGEVPARGEVVIFDSPLDGTRLIKRIVATAGDDVSLRAGELHVNGRSTRDRMRPNVEVVGDHVALLNLHYGGGSDLEAMRIPDGKLLVLGDSRGNSRDGRVFGLIDHEVIYGKAMGVFYRRGEGLVWKAL